MAQTWTTDTWGQCYASRWQGLCVPEAFQHPAKFSRALIARIYQHAREEGWLVPGAWILDPFSGVSLGAHDALLQGYNVVHCELEPRFHELAQANVALWHRRYGHLPGYGTAVLLQGDSRQLTTRVPGLASACVSSPPFASTDTKPTVLGQGKGTRATGKRADRNKGDSHYAYSPGNLATLAVSSPPYADGCTQVGPDLHPERMRGTRTGYLQREANGYGQTRGNLGNLTTGPVECVVSSPPWENQEPSHAQGDSPSTQRLVAGATGGRAFLHDAYGTSDGQLGTTEGDTFWSAARTILEQVYALLRPSGHAVWVVKGYVRNGQRVDFPGDWRRLCEGVGFVTVHEHHALLYEDHGTQTVTFA